MTYHRGSMGAVAATSRVSNPPAGSGAGFSFELVNARVMQNVLMARGFSVGSSGADGVFGSNSVAAMNAALRAAGLGTGEYSVEPDRRGITISGTALARIQALPTRSLPAAPASSPTYTSSSTSPEDIFPDIDSGAGTLPAWAPWAAGATALVGVGGFFIYRARQRKVAANRRRRSRR